MNRVPMKQSESSQNILRKRWKAGGGLTEQEVVCEKHNRTFIVVTLAQETPKF